MEEDIEEDVTSPNDNISAGAWKGFNTFSKATIFKNLESLLKESMQLNAHETKMVVEMIMIESKEKVQEMSKEEFIHKAKSIVENKIHQSSPFCPYCLRVFDRIRERNNHVKMIHEKLSVASVSSTVGNVKSLTCQKVR